MEHDFSTLIVLAEVTVAFVAFSSIVATIKLTIGDELNKFQRLLIHFFTESGMLSTTVCLLPLVLWEFWPDEVIVAQLVSGYTLLMTLPYLLWYIRRRLKVDYPTPLSSKLIIAGYFAWMPILIINATGNIWLPSISVITAITFWALVTSAVVFVTFLSTFVDKSAISVSMQTTETPNE